jgi:hypothetical protein
MDFPNVVKERRVAFTTQLYGWVIMEKKCYRVISLA